MRVLLASAVAVLLTACSQPAHQDHVAALPPECGADAGATAPPPDCRVAYHGDNYAVHYGEGSVTVDAGDQHLTETNISEYLPPSIEDIDGDGAPDILIGRESGNANVDYAVWRNVHGHYVRMGEASGVQFQRTADGLIAAPARSGAADWSVYFYSISDTAMTRVATVDVHAEADDQGNVTSTTCLLNDAPGIAALHLSRAQAQTKFCAEPAAKVFDQ
jgi:hypothetical protein